MMPVPFPSFKLTTVLAAKLYLSHSSAYAIRASSTEMFTCIASPARYQVRSVETLAAKVLKESTIAAISNPILLFIFIIFLFWPIFRAFNICTFISHIQLVLRCPCRFQCAHRNPVVFPFTQEHPLFYHCAAYLLVTWVNPHAVIFSSWIVDGEVFCIEEEPVIAYIQ